MHQILEFFAFPLNLVFAILWLSGAWYLYRYHRGSVIVRHLLSPLASLISIALLLGACLWMGFSGDRELASSFIFASLMLYLQTVLLLVLFRGWRRGKGIRWRFVLNHAGLLIAVSSAFWGAPDSVEMRMRIAPGQTGNEVFIMNGGRTWLPYEIELLAFDDVPSATVRVGEDEAVIRVNHPYRVGACDNIYLAGTGDGGCVLQIVREPWRYAALAGIVMMLSGAFLLFIKGPRS